MFYTLNVAGLKRDLPLCRVNDSLYIGAFVIFGDVELTKACARDLLKLAPEHDILITAESKGIPLVYEMAAQAGENRYLIARKVPKLYMKNVFTTEVNSITTEKKQILPNLKAGVWLYIICGLANGGANFLVIFLSSRMAASVMFPVISAGGIVLTFLISLFFYKEKLSKWQILGSALGLVSVIFLNL